MKIKLFTILAAAVLMLASCSSNKHALSYFNDLRGQESGVLGDVGKYELKIEPDDELVIVVNSLDPKASAMYNLPTVNLAAPNATSASTTPAQQTYVVNQLGDINFPVLGKLHVAGMTTIQLTDYLTKRIEENVKDPVVTVSLVNFAVNVIGEVKNPKLITAGSERLSVLDAIAAAGDMTEYAVKDNVIVIREQDGKRIFQRLDLKDAGIVNSPFFYMKQNDVVYVEPNQIKEANSRYNRDNSYKISVISTIVSSVSVIASLIIALTR